MPPSGWHFIEQGARLDGSSHDDLVATLQDYRTANHLPIGDPTAEVDDFVCRSWPNLCGGNRATTQDDDAPQQVYGQPVKRTLGDRVASWSANRYSRLGEITIVEPDKAEQRTSICVNCPHNLVSWRQNIIKNCPPCVERIASMDAILFKIRQGKDVGRCKKLGACSVLGQDNQTAVWLNSTGLQHAKHYQDELPQYCWLKT